MTLAHIYAALGDADKAFAWLDRARVERSPLLVYASVAGGIRDFASCCGRSGYRLSEEQAPLRPAMLR